MKKFCILILVSLVFFLNLVSFDCMAKSISNKLVENMTWPEVEKVFKTVPVVIIPIGAGSKEHGFHLPMNTDLIQANYFRDRLLERIDAVALPTITYNYFPAFIEYPGSISLELSTSVGMIADICRSLHMQGVKKIYFLNYGISPLRALEKAKNQLDKEGIKIAYTNLLIFDEQPEIKKITTQTRGTHADEIETSVMLYIAPGSVNMSKAKKDDLPDLGGHGRLTRNPNTKEGVYSPSGVWGDPTLATKEKGKIFSEALVEYLVKDVNKLVWD